ncbi:uncharacterized protein PHA67_018797 [Liasis olivaceus]
MKDQVVVDEMGKQPRLSVHGPCGKKNPQMCQDATTRYDPLKKNKSGLPRPWNATHSQHSPNNVCSLQLRLKKSSQEAATLSQTHIPIRSPTSVIKQGPRLTFSTKAYLPASRIPCPISRLPNPGGFSGCHVSLKGGQGERLRTVEKVQKHQNPVLGPPDLPMEQATLIKHGNSGLPLSVPATDILTSINLPFKSEESSSTPMQSSLVAFNNCPALISTSQVLKEQCGEAIHSLALISPGSDTKTVVEAAFLPSDDLSAPAFISEEVIASRNLHCEKHVSDLALNFPESSVQMEMLPSNLSKTGIMPAECPHLPTLPEWPIPSSPTILDFSSRVGQKKGSPKKKLGTFGSVSSTFSTKKFPESITGSLHKQDFVSSNHSDLPDTKIMLNQSYPLPSSSGAKEVVLSVFHDVSGKEELPLSSKTQLCTGIGPSNSSALSSEEKVLGRMEEEFNSGSGCYMGRDTSKHNSCILL